MASARTRWAVPAAACAAFVLTALYRFLATASLTNDEHEYLAGAQQILLGGEWPTRDFFDPGRPLMYVAAAAAQTVFGQTLFAEALLTSLAFGATAALLMIATHRLSGSLIVAAIATMLTVALFPRPYSYPKVLLYVAGPLVICARQLSGQWSRRAAMALLMIVAVFAANSILTIGNIAENLNRTDLGRGFSYAPTLLQQRTAGLQDRFNRRHVPSARIPALVPFFEYLDRCTTIEHRLFVAGYGPEIFTYARRLFAGGHGQFIQGYQVSDATLQQIVARLQQQSVLFALMVSDDEKGWRAESVPVDAHVRANFEQMAEIVVEEDRTIRVLLRHGSDAIRTGTDKATGWPCFR